MSVQVPHYYLYRTLLPEVGTGERGPRVETARSKAWCSLEVPKVRYMASTWEPSTALRLRVMLLGLCRPNGSSKVGEVACTEKTDRAEVRRTDVQRNTVLGTVTVIANQRRAQKRSSSKPTSQKAQSEPKPTLLCCRLQLPVSINCLLRLLFEQP